MNAPLNIQVEIARRLMDEFNADVGDDEQDRRDLIEGQTDALEMIAKLLRKAKEKEGYAEAMKAIISDNRDRKARLEDSATHLRKVAAWAMGELGLTKLPLPDMTVSLRDGKPPLIIDREPNAGDVDVGIARVTVTYAWDKEAVRKWMETTPFSVARLGNPEPVLTIRTK